jgi:hypothetical protein
MRSVVPFVLIAAMIGASPAMAQETHTYTCTVSDGTTMRYMIGPGVLRDYLDDKWAGNYCEEGGNCRYEGAQFVMDGGNVKFRFDPGTGNYIYAASDGSYEEQGTCKPD